MPPKKIKKSNSSSSESLSDLDETPQIVPVESDKSDIKKDNKKDDKKVSNDEKESEKESEEENNEDDDEEDEDETDEEEETDEEKDKDEEEDKDEGNECVYRFTGKKKTYVEEDEDFDEEDFFEEESIHHKKIIYVQPEERTTKPMLTKYERVRILGERARQIQLGAKPMVKNVSTLEPIEIAKLELKLGVVPMIIERPLPSGVKERWKVSELKIVN
jgi:DNA-directed RNA polymerase subunit K/omega